MRAPDFNAMLWLARVDIGSTKLPPRSYPAYSY